MSKYTFIRNYFKSIDSNEKAYILGFIFGDGSIYNKNRTSYLTIQVKDKDILVYIKKCMNYTGKIFIDKESSFSTMYTLRICSKELVKDLIDLGVIPNKSKIAKFPKIKKKYYRAFIAGIFDADGYIYIPKISAHRYRKIGFSGSSYMIASIKIELEKLNFSKVKTKIEKCGTHTIHYVTKHVEIFYEKIYKDSPYRLKRKDKKFKDNEIVQSLKKDVRPQII